jgi:hypothetical protein
MAQATALILDSTYPELRCGAAIQPLLKVDRLCFLVAGFFAV